MKISKILKFPSVRILLFMHEHEEVRYTDLARIFSSRGTLSSNLKTLEKEKLVERRVEPSKPIKAFYSLTNKGKEIAIRFKEMERIQKE